MTIMQIWMDKNPVRTKQQIETVVGEASVPATIDGPTRQPAYFCLSNKIVSVQDEIPDMAAVKDLLSSMTDATSSCDLRLLLAPTAFRWRSREFKDWTL
ncbi:hypothetical protein EGR_10839 [Echinococcus granulosus]|uniref:Uncharacterized protein n=1 Tax=Echinococcus granulosus TaxID=6210 RepID=W6TZW7_ECHGR|nr:hypothetical protein EGR_10839 [Echinococcus granulosus]EUB54298.1 hypothetical protein EGR_10839 [Echinococcus granulosus]